MTLIVYFETETGIQVKEPNIGIAHKNHGNGIVAVV